MDKGKGLLFGELKKLSEAFPEIDDIKIEYHENGVGIHKFSGNYNEQPTYVIDKQGVREKLRCANPLCNNGGYSIGDIIRDMVRERKTFSEFNISCTGHEGSSKRTMRRCYNSISGTVIISYKDLP